MTKKKEMKKKSSEPKKNPVGRPRKHPVKTSPVRPVGRPRKNPVKTSPVRPVGRPKKGQEKKSESPQGRLFNRNRDINRDHTKTNYITNRNILNSGRYPGSEAFYKESRNPQGRLFRSSHDKKFSEAVGY